MFEPLLKTWPIFLAAAAVIVWLIRLEGRVNENASITEARCSVLDRDLADHKKVYADTTNRLWEKLDSFRDTMTSILQALAKIDGKLEGSNSQNNRN